MRYPGYLVLVGFLAVAASDVFSWVQSNDWAHHVSKRLGVAELCLALGSIFFGLAWWWLLSTPWPEGSSRAVMRRPLGAAIVAGALFALGQGLFSYLFSDDLWRSPERVEAAGWVLIAAGFAWAWTALMRSTDHRPDPDVAKVTSGA
jgi:hypothetical protein